MSTERKGRSTGAQENGKYSRTGHLFQDRYKSEPVNDNRYFLTVPRCILYNPVRAGLCGTPEEYRWSSASDYFCSGEFTDTYYADEIMGHDTLMQSLKEPSDEICMDDTAPRANDKKAREMILEIVGVEDYTSCLQAIVSQPDRHIHRLRKAGLSIRQISRITGPSIAVVRK